MVFPNWFKNWIWNHPSFKGFREAEFRAASIDAFKKAHADLMETRVDDIEERAEELAKEKLAKLLSVVDENQVISKDKRGLIYLGGELAPDDRLQNMKSEAEFILSSEIWKVLCESPRKVAEKEIFLAGENMDAIKKGRSMIYFLSMQQNILNILKSWEKK